MTVLYYERVIGARFDLEDGLFVEDELVRFSSETWNFRSVVAKKLVLH